MSIQTGKNFFEHWQMRVDTFRDIEVRESGKPVRRTTEYWARLEIPGMPVHLEAMSEISEAHAIQTIVDEVQRVLRDDCERLFGEGFVLRCLRRGISIKQVSRDVGVARSTIRAIRERAEKAGRRK